MSLIPKFSVDYNLPISTIYSTFSFDNLNSFLSKSVKSFSGFAGVIREIGFGASVLNVNKFFIYD